jgi:hypothetical protein
MKEKGESKAKLSYKEALTTLTLDLKADHSSSEIKSAVREAVEGKWLLL